MTARSGSETRRKRRQVTYRPEDHEYKAAEAMAEARGVHVNGLGHLALTRLLELPAPRIRRRPHADVDFLEQALAKLGWIHEGINQAAKVANTNGDLPSLERLDHMRAEVREATLLIVLAIGPKWVDEVIDDDPEDTHSEDDEE